MRRTVFLLTIFLFFLSSCKVYQDDRLARAPLTQQEKTFIANFENDVVHHRRHKLLKYLLPEYKQEQLDGNYNGKIHLFWNQFFCGKQVKTHTFICLRLSQVKKINLVKVEKGDDSSQKVLFFEVQSKDHKIIQALILKILRRNGKTVLGLIGPYG